MRVVYIYAQILFLGLAVGPSSSIVYMIKFAAYITTINCFKRESWSSGYGRRLTFWRSFVWIPANILDGHLFTLICCKIVMFFEKTKINEKRPGLAYFLQPFVLWSPFLIPSTPSMLFVFKVDCTIFVIVLRKGRKYAKRGRVWPIFKKLTWHIKSLWRRAQCWLDGRRCCRHWRVLVMTLVSIVVVTVSEFAEVTPSNPDRAALTIWGQFDKTVL